jgi:AcrR family transcriptional regulator
MSEMAPRMYELSRRAERQAATRQRIVEAALELHQTVGANATTITAVAERAGVSRPTVYRHFPDEISLLVACTSLYGQRNPPPNPSSWLSVEDPELRLGFALTELYGFYADNEPMFGSAADAMPSQPALAQALGPFFAAIDAIRQLLGAGWGVDASPGSLLAGALGHAVDFGSWRSLRHQQGLTNDQAVSLMVSMVTAVREAALRDKQRSKLRARSTSGPW